MVLHCSVDASGHHDAPGAPSRSPDRDLGAALSHVQQVAVLHLPMRLQLRPVLLLVVVQRDDGALARLRRRLHRPLQVALVVEVSDEVLLPAHDVLNLLHDLLLLHLDGELALHLLQVPRVLQRPVQPQPKLGPRADLAHRALVPVVDDLEPLGLLPHLVHDVRELVGALEAARAHFRPLVLYAYLSLLYHLLVPLPREELAEPLVQGPPLRLHLRLGLHDLRRHRGVLDADAREVVAPVRDALPVHLAADLGAHILLHLERRHEQRLVLLHEFLELGLGDALVLALNRPRHVAHLLEEVQALVEAAEALAEAVPHHLLELVHREAAAAVVVVDVEAEGDEAAAPEGVVVPQRLAVLEELELAGVVDVEAVEDLLHEGRPVHVQEVQQLIEGDGAGAVHVDLPERPPELGYLARLELEHLEPLLGVIAPWFLEEAHGGRRSARGVPRHAARLNLPRQPLRIPTATGRSAMPQRLAVGTGAPPLRASTQHGL
mmetsp:Transcript_8198/g.23339  ORF Transcript_8198/g.23339 Transcript_8198/m.23339 type:complete len:491 (+) Transcript_8198:139-1611(+)|eukprot:CAMPEP_0118886778 /NCGR_PEP_ID=MMETSP1163-20130328/24747_1 /TAXON_ID=124430 /ORGANISM="Phaeomonas parva, Strain CCMP2877" /LENGTH=490 /DNA_ID=CAMNT_0006825081 /DNA_START=137 /DNA_END=1609 /DNA_ORIENTATION=+